MKYRMGSSPKGMDIEYTRKITQKEMINKSK